MSISGYGYTRKSIYCYRGNITLLFVTLYYAVELIKTIMTSIKRQKSCYQQYLDINYYVSHRIFNTNNIVVAI